MKFKWKRFFGIGCPTGLTPSQPKPDGPPFPAVVNCPRDELEDAVAWYVCQQMRAVVYMRAPGKARQVARQYRLVDLILEPDETTIDINYKISITTTAILAGLTAYLSERGSKII
jgi:hypothetical protein